MTDLIPSFYAATMTKGGMWAISLSLALLASWVSNYYTELETHFFREACKMAPIHGVPTVMTVRSRTWHKLMTCCACALTTWLTLDKFENWAWALAVCGYVAMLATLARIDAYTGFLPDRLNYLLLWSGLLFNLESGWVPLEEAVLGVVAGYMPLWLGQQLCWRWRGLRAMGNGDFKFAAALGACCGYQPLASLLLLASILALLAQALRRVLKPSLRGAAVPFGPFLALGGAYALFTCLTQLT